MRRNVEKNGLIGKRPGVRGVKTHALVASLHFDKPVTRPQAACLARRAIERTEIALPRTERWHPRFVKIRSWSVVPPAVALKMKKPPTVAQRRYRARSLERKRLSKAILAYLHGEPSPLEAAIARLEKFEPWTDAQRKRDADVRIVLAELRRRMIVAGPLTEEDISGRPPRLLRETPDPIPAGKEKMPTTPAAPARLRGIMPNNNILKRLRGRPRRDSETSNRNP